MENNLLNIILIVLSQFIFVLLLSPLVRTAIKKVKARMQNRMGPPLWQGHYDLWKLFQKESITSIHSSFISQIAPWLIFGATASIIFFLPVLFLTSPIYAQGDMILIIYLLALGTFFMILSGLDAGSAFGGMGSSREALIYSLSEPAAILSIFSLALTNQSTNLSVIISSFIANPNNLISAGNLFIFLSLMIVCLAENARIPVDNPATHLELTMVHEAMILDYSGRHLALIEWASSIKLTVFFILIANLFFPFGLTDDMTFGSILISIISLLAKILVMVLLIGVWESSIAKLRLFRLPEFIGISIFLAILGVLSNFILNII